MIDLQNIIHSLLWAFILTRFTALRMLLESVKLTKWALPNLFILYVKYLCMCSVCSSFLVGIIITQDIYYSIICAFIMTWYERLLGRIEIQKIP